MTHATRWVPFWLKRLWWLPGRLLCALRIHAVRYDSISFPIGHRPPCAQWLECARPHCRKLLHFYPGTDFYVWSEAMTHRMNIRLREQMMVLLSEPLYADEHGGERER